MDTRQLRQPHAALHDLCDGFFESLAFLDRCPRVAADALPPVCQRLLAHREHMTSVLEAYYRQPIALAVLSEERGSEHYTRKIALSLASSGAIVELGIVRMEFRYIPRDVQAEILARRAPLGDILIRHNVLRRVAPRWYFHFPPDTPIAQAFGLGAGPAYGRVGTIYCDEEPAIDLLEVVCDRQHH